MRRRRVLVVDDEDRIREIVRGYLEQDDFEVAEARDGDEALRLAREFEPDVVVLDVMMPGRDGIEVLQELRAMSDVYVILLTAKAEEVDKLVGLSVGADDYLTKPFSPRELVARVKTVLRRERTTGREGHAERLEFEQLAIDLDRREATLDGGPVDLTSLQFDLLVALARAPGRVFTRRQLIEQVWGWDFYGDERVVDVHIRNLRRALSDDAEHPKLIGTVRGVGYKFVGVSR
ncbi:MAG: response regulator transcription factor [Acidimicrobiia bacterium]